MSRVAVALDTGLAWCYLVDIPSEEIRKRKSVAPAFLEKQGKSLI